MARYRPHIVQADVFGPLPEALGTFTSIGLNFLLHCLPERSGNTTKWQALATLGAHLSTNGTLFGSTIGGPPKDAAAARVDAGLQSQGHLRQPARHP